MSLFSLLSPLFAHLGFSYIRSCKMDDNKELELSLGLACNRSSSPSKDTSDSAANGMADTDERTSKILNDFRNFLNAGVPQSFQRTDPVKPEENFFNKFQQNASGGNDSTNGAGAGDSKRKNTFVGLNNNKKQETGSYSSVVQEKENNSHISITTTDEGSTGDNDDVAESEVEGSTSRTGSHCDDESKTFGGSATSSQALKESQTDGKSIASATSFPVQAMNISSVPYSRTIEESPLASDPSTSVYPSSMPGISSSNCGQPCPQTTSTVTYSSVKIPDKDSPWGMSRPQPLHSPYAGGGSGPTSASMQVTNLHGPGMRPLDQQRGSADPKLVGGEGSSFQPEGDASSRANSRFPSEYPAIRPGIVAEVKFGGSGSFPNLPWVSTTGPGPNGKTISGVTYKFNATQIKIVCACHGVHLSPDEFVRHATDDQSSVVTSSGLASLQSGNPSTTTPKR